MRKPFNPALIAVVSALIGAIASAPAAFATPSTTPLSPVSTMSAFSCSNPNTGLGNINLTTLEFTSASAAQTCVMAGYNVAAYNPNDARIYSVNINGSTATLVANDVQGRNLSLWSGQNKIVISGTSGNVTAFAINPLTGAAIVSDANKRIYTLNLTTGVASNPVSITPAPSVGYYAMAYSPDGTLYGYLAGTPATLYSLNPSTGAASLVLSDLRSALPHASGTVYALAFDANGTAYFAADADNGGGDSSTSFYSATITDIAGTAAEFFSTTQTANYGHAWSGTASSWKSITTLLITYGNLAVNFDSQGGTAEPASHFYSKTINDSVTPHIVNPAITLPTPTRTGYSFNGWFTSASGGTLIGLAGANYTPYSDTSINMYAQWTADELPHTGFDGTPYAASGFFALALGFVALSMSRRRRQG